MVYLPGMVLDSAFERRYVCLGRFFASNNEGSQLGLKAMVLDRGKLATGTSCKNALRTWYDLGGAIDLSPSPVPPALPGGEGITVNLMRTGRPKIVLVAKGFRSMLDALIEDLDSRGAGSWPRGVLFAVPFPVSPEGWPREFTTGSDGLGLAILKVGGNANPAIVRAWSQVGGEVTDLTALPS
jgi:hypothetical protein